MKRRLDRLVDKGCWISHDRVYAFVSADHGITEVGYHGMQPVSRNSRILVKNSGALLFSLRGESGQQKLQTQSIQWNPSGIEAETEIAGGKCTLAIAASGRRVMIRCRPLSDMGHTMSVTLAKDALFAAVHEERSWTTRISDGNRLLAGFRDRIMLHAWMDRTGPYAGDFLIPEPTRRRIFNGSKRSGLANRDDLREEYRLNDFPLYDADTTVIFGGEGFLLREVNEGWLFERAIVAGETAEFIVEFSDEDSRGAAGQTSRLPDESANDHVRTSPVLGLTGFPHLEEFVTTVPPLVDSCLVSDFGIPRACPGRYYWLWAWDALATMSESLRWGDTRNAARSVDFVETHRDENGHIPARWTRSLQPLDTPSAGGIEFLHASLAYDTFLETGDQRMLKICFPSFRRLFEAVESDLLQRGYVTGEGFYPDLLAVFGRSEETAVCMETGCWYAFCRILENVSVALGELPLKNRLDAAAASIADKFDIHFWDLGKGFFRDALNATTGTRSAFHPLFSMLFLQSPLGMHLVRPHMAAAAGFISRELMTNAGVRVLPLSETSPGGESIIDSWYPHWDLYALKLLRRTGDAESIMRWLALAEGALSRLGYCPEFLALKGFREGDLHAWEQHGSASNLNCVTSWLRGIRESILGFELDPGGITHVPLSLPMPAARMDGIQWQGASWSFENVFQGPHFDCLVVDGTVIEGTAKIPVRFHTPGTHRVTARYGAEPRRTLFTEVINAKVLDSKVSDKAVEIRIEPLGFVDVALFSPEMPVVTVDDVRVSVEWNKETGCGCFSLPSAAPCAIILQKS